MITWTIISSTGEEKLDKVARNVRQENVRRIDDDGGGAFGITSYLGAIWV